VAVGGVYAVRSVSTSSAPADRTQPARVDPPAAASASPAATGAPAETSPGDDGVSNAPPLPTVLAPPRATTGSRTAPTTPASAASPLAAETAALDAARAALRSHRPADALRALDSYDAKFPRGVLAPEAMVMRIEALVGVGDRAGAQRLADTFLAAWPNSPLAARVRALVRSTSNP
jgi:hypothetical protein